MASCIAVTPLFPDIALLGIHASCETAVLACFLIHLSLIAMHVPTSFLLATQLIEQEKVFHQEQQQILFLPNDWQYWNGLSESELISMLEQLSKDFANGVVSTLRYLSFRKLLLDHIQQVRRATS